MDARWRAELLGRRRKSRSAALDRADDQGTFAANHHAGLHTILRNECPVPRMGDGGDSTCARWRRTQDALPFLSDLGKAGWQVADDCVHLQSRCAAANAGMNEKFAYPPASSCSRCLTRSPKPWGTSKTRSSPTN